MGIGATGPNYDTMKVEDNGVGTNGDHSLGAASNSLVHQLANAVSPPQVLHDEEVSQNTWYFIVGYFVSRAAIFSAKVPSYEI